MNAVGRLPRGALGRRLARIRARVRRRRLDDALAHGQNPWAAPELLVRASHLTSFPVRRRLSLSLEEVIAEAEGRCAPSPYLRVRRAVVLERREALRVLAARVRQPAPLDVAVVARLALLVWDESSPVYVGGRHPVGIDVAADLCLQARGDAPTGD